MVAQDYSTVGLASRSEAEKSLHRAMAFAVLLVLAHLLDIKPSEFDALGLKIVMSDAIILYGLLTMLFGFYLSQFFNQSETSSSFLPLSVGSRRMRANIRAVYRTHMADKSKRRTPLKPKQLKKQARQIIAFGNILLLPYRIIATCFILGGIIFSAVDIYKLGAFIWIHSRFNK